MLFGLFSFRSPDSTPAHRSIFDKLTDPSLYTGSHKHRFDEEGRGRGLEGRDSVSKGLGTGAVLNYYGDGPVISIAQLVRNDKLDPQHMNKVRTFADGTSVLSPVNRSLKNADGKWRPELPRDVYPHNNPQTFQRQLAAASPMASPNGAAQMRLMSGSQSARSLSTSSSQPPQLQMSPRTSRRPVEQLNPHAHDINLLTAQGRGLYGGEYAQDGQYAPQQRGPVHRTPGTSPRVSRTPSRSPARQHSFSGTGTPGHASSASHLSHSPSQPLHSYEQYQQPQGRPQLAEYHSSPIFDKLTNPQLYTGTHRQRFDEQG
jgi:hypothetical protein